MANKDKLYAKYGKDGLVDAIVRDGDTIWKVGEVYTIPGNGSEIVEAKLVKVTENEGSFVMSWREQVLRKVDNLWT